MRIQELYNLFKMNPIISIDSRTPGNGGIFFALKGDRFNGNQFAEAAIDNGCSLAVIDDAKFARDDRFLFVDDSLACLQNLAAHHRDQFNIPVIGITGTNGKTTTKELISKVLKEKYSVVSTMGNLNNQIGVPLTLLAMKDDTQIAVVEMGANHLGEIADLCHIAKPTHGLITNIGIAHLEGFGSKENIRKAKSELYDYLEDHEGIIFYNDRDETLTRLVDTRSTSKIPYCNGELHVKKELQGGKEFYLTIQIGFEGKEYTLNTKLAGTYNLDNVMAALQLGVYFNVAMDSIIQAVESYYPENNRSQFIKTRYNQVLLDAYNANPTSMNLAIDNFIASHGKDGMFILGDMLELGTTSDSEHKKLISKLHAIGSLDVVLVGEIFCKVATEKDFRTFKTVDELFVWMRKNPVKSRDVFIKGSRRIALEKVVDLL